MSVKAKIVSGELKGVEFEISTETLAEIQKAQKKPTLFQKIRWGDNTGGRYILNLSILSSAANRLLRKALDNGSKWVSFEFNGCDGIDAGCAQEEKPSVYYDNNPTIDL